MPDAVDLDGLEALARAATPGPWGWRGNASGKSLELRRIGGWGEFVLAFRRWGFRGAVPAFNVDQFMERACELFIRPEPHNPWRVTGIDHPDARYLEAADPTTLLALIERVRRAEAAVAEREATRA